MNIDLAEQAARTWAIYPKIGFAPRFVMIWPPHPGWKSCRHITLIRDRGVSCLPAWFWVLNMIGGKPRDIARSRMASCFLLGDRSTRLAHLYVQMTLERLRKMSAYRLAYNEALKRECLFTLGILFILC